MKKHNLLARVIIITVVTLFGLYLVVVHAVAQR